MTDEQAAKAVEDVQTGLVLIAQAVERLANEVGALAYAIAGGARHTDREAQLR